MNDQRDRSRNGAFGDQTSMTQSHLIFRKVHRSGAPALLGGRPGARSWSCLAIVVGLTGSAAAQQTEPDGPQTPASPAEASTTGSPADGDASAPDVGASAADGDGSDQDQATPVVAASTASAAAAIKGESPASKSEAALSPEQSRALWPLTWKKTPGQGVAFGLEEGLWGGTWAQGLRITVPFASNFAATLRGIYLLDAVEDVLTVDAGGRLDFVGRSEVLFNVMRLYGGGGVQVIAPVANTAGKEVRVGGGGHFGFEFFCSPHYSFFLEVGGQGGSVAPGATVLAGMMVYPWTR